MHLDTEAINQSQRSMGNMPMYIDVEGRLFVIYWIRLIEGASESLLTTSTRHSVYEIEYALHRPLTIQIGNQSLFIPEGSFLIVPPNMDHQITRFEPDGVKFILGFSPHSPTPAAPALDGMQTSCVLPDVPMIRTMVSALTVALATHSLYMLPSLIDGVVRSFLHTSIPSDALSPHRQTSESEQHIQRFLEYVKAANGIGVTVSSAAYMLNISERHLFRLCTAITGSSPSAIISEHRLAYIRTCLQQTHLTLTEIADLAGFQSEYAMTKFFRRFESVTPSAYRRRAD